MTNEKIYHAVISGTKDYNIKFKDLQRILYVLGFNYRIKGDHFIYTNRNIIEIINIQSNGNLAKGYQVKQIS